MDAHRRTKPTDKTKGPKYEKPEASHCKSKQTKIPAMEKIPDDEHREQLVLDLKEHLTKYDGLEVKPKEATDSVEAEVVETIVIAEWTHPDWSAEPLWKLDYPEMGYRTYEIRPPPPHG